MRAKRAATDEKPAPPEVKRGRPTIAAARIVDLSLYSRNYEDFMVTGWPDDVPYPVDAKSLQPDKAMGSIKAWDAYKILNAFYVGTKLENHRHRLKFQKITWSAYFVH